MEPEKGQKSTRKLEEGVRKRPNKGEEVQGPVSSAEDITVSGQEELSPHTHFPGSLKIAREGPPRRVGRPCKPKVPLLGQLHVSKSQPASPAFMAPRLDTEHSHEDQVWQVLDPIQSGPSRSFSSSASHARLSRPAEDPTQKVYVQRPTQVSVKQADEPPKKEKKSQKPGKYICQYCSRPCAKPSVLQKHIRSHTGERPYPCVPCGFSFKTKSNLYKHRKSHAHRIKAGLASEISVETYPSSLEMERLGGEEIDDPSEGESTDSEDETSTMSNLVELSPQQKHHLTCDTKVVSRHQVTAHDLFSLSQQNISQTSEESVTFTEPSSELVQKSEDTHSIKQKLALRLSERKKASEEQTFLSPGSKGSTESGYFSRSESAEQQISPPNTNAKSYAEIILGKCGRIGQRSTMLASPSALVAAEEKTAMASMSVPRTQVIEHITKLITINEAVVDTSEIDSVKPRRSSLSRRGSIESPKGTLYRESFQFDVKSPGSQLDPKSEKTKAEHPFPSLQHSHGATDTVPLLRSHSMPSSASTSSSPHPFRASYSFDDRIVDSEALGHSHMFSSHPRLLKRQPAIELPLGMDYSLDEGSLTVKDTAVKTSEDVEGKESEVPKKSKKGGRVKGLTYECNICGARYKKKGNYETHKKYYCSELQIMKPPSLSSQSSVEIRKELSEQEAWPPVMSYKLAPNVELSTLRKRRKEKSLGDDEEPQMADWSEYPSTTALESHFAPSTTSLTLCSDAPKQFSGRSESTSLSDVESKEKTMISKEISVIQHTSSFEKSESIEKKSSFDEEDMTVAQVSVRPHTQSSHPLQPKLVRQHNIQVPEILVTEEPDKPEADIEDPPKEQEKVEEFQWPQRSQTLAQLPAEKLPPKKKRLRLAEMAQSSGDSSFESMSLTRSPSQDSSISHASSHSLSIDREEGSKSEVLGLSSEGTTKALGHHMLTVPSHHHHMREMRRSASEQTPNISHTPQVSENRSKSFDYGNLTSSTSTSMPTAQERRKCFSLRQTSLSRHVEIEPELLPHDWKESDKPSTSSQVLGMGSHEQSSGISPKEQQSSPSQSKQRTIHSVTSETENSYLSQQLSIFPIQPLLHLAQHPSELLPSQVMSSMSAPFSVQPITHSIFHTPQIPLQPGLLHPDHVQIPLDIPVRSHSPFLSLPYSASSSLPHTFFMPIQPQFALPVSAQVGCHYPQIKPEVSPPLSISNISPSKDYFSGSIHPSPHSPLASESSAQVTLSHSESVVSLVVPVRIQTHMPSYGNAMYTTLSQMLVTQPPCCPSSLVMHRISDGQSKGYHGIDLPHVLPKDQRIVSELPYLSVPFPKTDPSNYIPLTSSVEGVLGFDGSSSSVGGSKRMLSPAGSLELTMETQQQKRVKEEDDPEDRLQKPLLKSQSVLEQSRSTNIAVLTSSPQNRSELLTPPLPSLFEPLTALERHKIQLVPTTLCQLLLQEEQIKEDSIKVKEEKDDKVLHVPTSSSTPPSHVTVSLQEAEAKNASTFPTLHTTTNVSWCYLNYVKPNHMQQSDRRASVYSSWSISLYNPNLPGVSTRVALSLLRSKQKMSSEIYTIANAPQLDSNMAHSQTRKPKMTEQAHIPTQAHKETPRTNKEEEKRVKSEDSGPTPKRGEPSRVRIFEGGYKSNEEYVYVRGRGRGKYVCEECGIRCKKPSMLKKHIRTHTDHRPYVCKHCNFAFKTKGNLTKHMKSKAHSKKCQELGLVPPSFADLDAEEGTSEERWPESDVVEEHQFSDLEDTDDDEDSDGEEEDDDDEDESQEEKNPDISPSTVTSYSPNEPRQNPDSADNTSACQFSSRQLQTSESSGKDSQTLLLSDQSVSQELIPSRPWSPGKDIGSSRAGPSRRHLLQKRESSPKCFSPTGCTSPRRGMSPCQRLPSAREVSPLRCVSPQQLSPHRSLSPRAYMSPERGSSPPVRHLSPSSEVTSLRYAAFRGGLASPSRYPSLGREEPHHTRSDAQIHLKAQHGVLPSRAQPHGTSEPLESSGIKKPRPSVFPAVPRTFCSPLTPHTLPRSGENLFTHLPLHSQHLQRTPYPMIPIGGIQMVQARPSPQPSLVGPILSELHVEGPDKEAPQERSEQPLRTNRREEDRAMSTPSTAPQHSPTPSTYCQTACTPSPPPGTPHSSVDCLKEEHVEGEG
ncbi:transcription factor HIVEP3 isoform X1 [Bufo gargarizans]|uniref:transcription factor HIVEP3 isoform X1 n=1 Tax=Bufo gargarizans TaxID=30331 RepID=UPI001CF5840B|nr:transcription factor HIVEP3 isoform X1 [Bufo gargarizans]XP_044143886.1 transcription factor HIVEP3 isoform X1 [Bufo gargarizans]XP_044143887.1 transcription factor HIVEP3 isoform X1 [Bufo gargarizans]